MVGSHAHLDGQPPRIASGSKCAARRRAKEDCMRETRSRGFVRPAGARPRLRLWSALWALLALGAVLPGVAAASRASDRYAQVNLVSDLPGVARLMDPNLVNPWGLSQGPTTPVWSSNQGTNTSTVYPGAVGPTDIA